MKEKLLDFVTKWHGKQLRKYTDEPYIVHLLAVASRAEKAIPFGYEVGMCHDLVEDTDCTYKDIQEFFESIGYSNFSSLWIVKLVDQLTDVYTSEAYPNLNRATRKKLEAERLHKVHPDAQTVKYCDLIDNTSSIVKYDKDFAKVYLDEKQYILSKMNRGDKVFYSEALDTLFEAKNQLEK